MSLAIENLKFTIFGSGHDYTLNNSGSGVKSYEEDVRAYCAVIDETNTYMWLVGNNGTVSKRKISDFSLVEQSAIPSAVSRILHPSNVSNNYGVATGLDGTTAYVFDLTDDTLYGTVTGTFPSDVGFTSYDCILVNNKIYFVNTRTVNANNHQIYIIDLSDMTFDGSVTTSGKGICGFISNSLVYGVYSREWFYQTSCAYGIALDGSVVWSNTGIDRNDYLDGWGFTGNGKIYCPVLIDDTWHFGEFDALSSPSFNPVSPSRTFGSFESVPALELSGHGYNLDVAYNDGKTRACVWTRLGLLLTDFHKVEKISDENVVPLACSDRYIICSDYDTDRKKLYVYGV